LLPIIHNFHGRTLKKFREKQLTVKSKDCRVDLLRANASNPNSNTGEHFDLNRLNVFGGYAFILPKKSIDGAKRISSLAQVSI
jgi:hypothetical protein